MVIVYYTATGETVQLNHWLFSCLQFCWRQRTNLAG